MLAQGEKGCRINAEQKFLELIQRNQLVNHLLDRLDELGLPDAWLVSGCLFQTVWNVQANEIPTRAIKDYDIFYFDKTDRSSAAEDKVNRKASAVFADLDCDIDVRNQARVHVWYEREFGVRGYPVLGRSTDGIDNFLAVCCMVAVKKSDSGDFELYAPFGVDDVLQCVMRQNPWFPNAPRDFYYRKAERWREYWPALKVEPFVRPKYENTGAAVSIRD